MNENRIDRQTERKKGEYENDQFVDRIKERCDHFYFDELSLSLFLVFFVLS